MAETKPRRRRKKEGKFVPLIWLFTGVLIAFFISFSAVFDNSGGKSAGKGATNRIDAGRPKNTSAQNTNTLSFISKLTNFKIQQAVTGLLPTHQQTTSNDTSGSIELKIYLGKQIGNSIRITEKRIMLPASVTLLKDTVNALIADREDTEMVNAIPFNTKLRNLWIKDGIAHIDFSDEFAYNSFGTAGYKIQIYQIVYTAVQFDGITAVSFYVEGKPVKYLGGDGFIVNNPVYPFSIIPEFPIQ